MREIKFRIWNGKKMLFPNVIDGFATGIDNHTCYCSNDGWWDIKPSELMLFTGLQDKNGVEIYEGDNLRLTNGKFWWTYVVSTIPNNRTSTLYAVEVEHNVTSEDDRYTYEISDSRKGIRNELEFLDCKRLEVIGNIHENKELLK